MLELKAYKIRKELDTKLPEYGTEYSACFDIFSSFDETDNITIFSKTNDKLLVSPYNREISFYPGDRALIPTNLIFKIPVGYSMRCHPKSGLSLKNGVSLFNCEGVIDRDYPEQSYIALANNSLKSFIIKPNMKLCQAELVTEVKVKFSWDDTPELDIESNRVSGFGSTGLH